jgi:hypothetical protein
MNPERIPIKGPVGKNNEGRRGWPMPEPQESYEENGVHSDLVDGNFTQDPFTLKAPEADHTPNASSSGGIKKGKPEYGKFSSGKFGL